MNKKDLIDAVAAELGEDADAAARAVDAVIASLTKGIATDRPVSIPGFGSFTKKNRSQRERQRQPTGAPIEIHAAKTVAFVPDRALTMVVSGTREELDTSDGREREGIDTVSRETRMTIIPGIVYLDCDDEDQIARVETAIIELMASFGCTDFSKSNPVRGSWLRVFGFRSRADLEDEVANAIHKGLHSLDIALDKGQASANKENAEALAKLLEATDGIPEVHVLLGNIQYRKTVSSDGISQLDIRTLTPDQSVELKRFSHSRPPNKVSEVLPILRGD